MLLVVLGQGGEEKEHRTVLVSIHMADQSVGRAEAQKYFTTSDNSQTEVKLRRLLHINIVSTNFRKSLLKAFNLKYNEDV
ncbi:uncharacterized protein V6R79_015499 [Siganus canaliculatus]